MAPRILHDACLFFGRNPVTQQRTYMSQPATIASLRKRRPYSTQQPARARAPVARGAVESLLRTLHCHLWSTHSVQQSMKRTLQVYTLRAKK